MPSNENENLVNNGIESPNKLNAGSELGNNVEKTAGDLGSTVGSSTADAIGQNVAKKAEAIGQNVGGLKGKMIGKAAGWAAKGGAKKVGQAVGRKAGSGIVRNGQNTINNLSNPNAASDTSSKTEKVKEDAKEVANIGVEAAGTALNAAKAYFTGDVISGAKAVKGGLKTLKDGKKFAWKKCGVIVIAFLLIFVVYFLIKSGPYIGAYLQLSDLISKYSGVDDDDDDGTGESQIDCSWNGNYEDLGSCISKLINEKLYPAGEDGYCARWVRQSFLKIGASLPGGNARDYYYRHSETNLSAAKAGMIIATNQGTSTDSKGVPYGHVGLIYIDSSGGLKVADAGVHCNAAGNVNLGNNVCSHSLSEWASTFCHGTCHLGYDV